MIETGILVSGAIIVICLLILAMVLSESKWTQWFYMWIPVVGIVCGIIEMIIYFFKPSKANFFAQYQHWVYAVNGIMHAVVTVIIVKLLT